MPGIMGRKIGMTRVMADDGSVIPVSVIECTPNVVLQVKKAEKDGYPALVLGFAAYKKERKVKKFKHVGEFRTEADSELERGATVKVDDLKEVKVVTVVGWAKGRGFAGVIKRHKFSRGPETHGSHHHRQPGSSSGPVTGTGRVPKGKRYPGHMGTQRVSKRGVPVISIDTEKNLIVLKGPVPGAPDGLIQISY